MESACPLKPNHHKNSASIQYVLEEIAKHATCMYELKLFPTRKHFNMQ